MDDLEVSPIGTSGIGAESLGVLPPAMLSAPKSLTIRWALTEARLPHPWDEPRSSLSEIGVVRS